MYQTNTINTVEKITKFLDKTTEIQVVELSTDNVLYRGKNSNTPKYLNTKSVYNVNLINNILVIQIFTTIKNSKIVTFKINKPCEVK